MVIVGLQSMIYIRHDTHLLYVSKSIFNAFMIFGKGFDSRIFPSFKIFSVLASGNSALLNLLTSIHADRRSLYHVNDWDLADRFFNSHGASSVLVLFT